ncbi:MAG: CHASE2 domain-containing protein, partial [Candidatus Marinimicrobia bacterium]|nr:CHASE2 domain-containing protein [Candidatus Neomarinimicrobiota bacterium]
MIDSTTYPEISPDYYQVYRQAQDNSEAQFIYMVDAYDIMYTVSGREEWDGYNFAVVPIYADTSREGYLIDSTTLIKPKALLFDIIFDPENTFNFDLVKALNSDNTPNDEYLTQVTDQFLLSNDPKRFVYSTYESQKAYHALVFEQEDSLNFLYKMDSELEGYDRPDHIIQLPESQAEQLPKADRMGNTFPDLLQASVRTGSANFPQDSDGIIRRSPTAIWFEGPDHVYPSLTMAAAMDILGVPNDGFVYNFEKRILTLRDTTGTVVREIPIDEKGRMYVNYYGYYKTFYYLPYMYCMDPEMLDPSYWKGKVALVGASLPGLMDLRNTPVQETFAGVEVHANVIHSILQNEFVSITDETTNLWSIIFICVLLGLLVSIPSKPLYTLPVPLVAIVVWVIFTYNEYLTTLIMWEIVRPSISIGGTYLGIFLYNFLVVEKDKRFLKNTFSTYISPELIDQMYDNKEEPSLGGEEGYHTAFFTDIQSFSAFSEKLTASDLVE